MAPIKDIIRTAYCDGCPADPMIRGGSARSFCPLNNLLGYRTDLDLDDSPEIGGNPPQATRSGDRIYCLVGGPHIGALQIER
jgi:hypothetical protein